MYDPQDEKRTVFRFTPVVAPVKTTVFPLLQKAELLPPARAISASLTRAGVSNLIDTTGVNCTEFTSSSHKQADLMIMSWLAYKL